MKLDQKNEGLVLFSEFQITQEEDGEMGEDAEETQEGRNAQKKLLVQPGETRRPEFRKYSTKEKTGTYSMASVCRGSTLPKKSSF